jgi:hypothetical protein
MTKNSVSVFDLKNDQAYNRMVLSAQHSLNHKVLQWDKAKIKRFFACRNEKIASIDKFSAWKTIEQHHIKALYDRFKEDSDLPFTFSAMAQNFRQLGSAWFGKRENQLIKFIDFQNSQLRKSGMQSVSKFLLMIWLDNLTQRDQFEFWFNYMDANDRCRLWNALVFSYKPFF